APNRNRMLSAGQVVWLYAEPETLADRIRGDANRPLLKGVDPLVKARELAIQRNPIYEELSHLKVDTGLMDSNEAVDEIMSFLSGCGDE
ncbi:MAG: shikimate kinase, partial [Mariprofundaceae bacterium]